MQLTNGQEISLMALLAHFSDKHLGLTMWPAMKQLILWLSQISYNNIVLSLLLLLFLLLVLSLLSIVELFNLQWISKSKVSETDIPSLLICTWYVPLSLKTSASSNSRVPPSRNAIPLVALMIWPEGLVHEISSGCISGIPKTKTSRLMGMPMAPSKRECAALMAVVPVGKK